MKILNQGEDLILNIDNTTVIGIALNNNKKIVSIAIDGKERLLGEYVTEERTKEVLLEIFSKMKANGFDFTYEMPKE